MYTDIDKATDEAIKKTIFLSFKYLNKKYTNNTINVVNKVSVESLDEYKIERGSNAYNTALSIAISDLRNKRKDILKTKYTVKQLRITWRIVVTISIWPNARLGIKNIG